MIKSKQHKNLSLQKGISLIEGLVVMVVFSTGLLGLAAMQAVSLSRTDEVKQATIASFKAQELIDRMHATVSSTDADGLIPEFTAAISPGVATFADSGIGDDVAAELFVCPAAAPVNCSGLDGGGAPRVCDTAEIVAYDIWEVLCDPNTGLATSDEDVGSIGVQSMQIAIIRTPVAGSVAGVFDNELYIEWVANSSDSNAEFDGQTINTNLCGVDRAIDASLEVYCVKF